MADRRVTLAAIVEHFAPENEDILDDLQDEPLALVQYRGGRAPNEKWVSLFNSVGDALSYAASGEEWRPEQLIALDSGITWELGTQVIRTKKLRTRYGS